MDPLKVTDFAKIYPYNKIVESMRQRPLICTAITSSNMREVLDEAKLATQGGSDIAELRLDYLVDHNPSSIQQIISNSPIPLIIVNRNKENGGLFESGNEEKRLSLLYDAIEAKPAFIDIELLTEPKMQSELVKTAKENNVGVLCSYHNFKNTPSAENIIQLYNKACKIGADLVKLVFTPNAKTDVTNILQAVVAVKSERTPSTIFGMGNIGQITRIVSPVLGSCMTYCAIRPDPTNGLSQLSLEDTVTIFKLIKVKENEWSVLRNKHLKTGIHHPREMAVLS